MKKKDGRKMKDGEEKKYREKNIQMPASTPTSNALSIKNSIQNDGGYIRVVSNRNMLDTSVRGEVLRAIVALQRHQHELEDPSVTLTRGTHWWKDLMDG